MEVITKTDLPLKLFSRGKVRDTYELGENLLMVSTDRLSAFDVIFGDGIPWKGTVLNELSLFWFEKLSPICKNHIISTEIPASLPSYLRRRSMLVKRAKIIPIECVVRGYLAGSGLKDYNKTGSVCGIKLPQGLKNSSRLPESIFTPATKEAVGIHDVNIDAEKGAELIGADAYRRIEELSIRLYSAAADYSRTRGIILADTKFEFGFYDDELILADEVLTPDSSRYWPADKYEEGRNQDSFDKQYVRDYLERIGWNKQPPPPPLPPDVISRTSEKYIEAYEKLTGKKFAR